MAVQGAAARMMEPAMYWSASAGDIQGLKIRRKKSQAKKAMLNGLTIQLTKRVTNSPLGFLPTLTTEPKSTLSIIG